MRALLCPRPHELTLVERPKPDVAAAFRAGPPAARRRVRRRPAHFRGHAALFRLSPGDRPRALRRGRGGRRGRPLPTRPARRDHSLSALRPLRRVPARQDQLLPDCQRLNVLGVHSDGGMADWLCVPDDNLVDASGVGLDEAAMAEFPRHRRPRRATRRNRSRAESPHRGRRANRHRLRHLRIFARRRCSTRDRIGWTSAARRSASITS